MSHVRSGMRSKARVPIVFKKARGLNPDEAAIADFVTEAGPLGLGLGRLHLPRCPSLQQFRLRLPCPAGPAATPDCRGGTPG